VIAAAADVADGQAWLERNVNDYGHRLATTQHSSSSVTVEVQAVSIPSILQRLGWSRIGLLKIDIEGHERSLLWKGNDWLRDVDAICLEYHFDDADSEMTRLAGQFGFAAPRKLPGEIWLLVR
jgi:FkbM family methyltransferase